MINLFDIGTNSDWFSGSLHEREASTRKLGFLDVFGLLCCVVPMNSLVEQAVDIEKDKFKTID